MAFRFSTFELDQSRRELRNRGALVSLSPKSFDVLCYLIEHRDRMVAKSELLDQFWSTQVSETALQKVISLLRKAMGCDGQLVIRTYHGLGFRFVPELLTQPKEPLHDPEGSRATLQERRLISVLCLRFGAEASNDVDAVENFLHRARAQVDAQQGEALRMTLEGFTVSFGLTSQCEDAARRAVHCAVALFAALRKISGAGASIGIDHGLVDLSENPANTLWRRPTEIERGAVELANAGAPHDILLSETAQHQLRDEVISTAAHGGFRLEAVNEMQAGVPGRPQKRPTPFIGRSAELAFLFESLETLASGNGHGVVLSGPAGIGKTRLLSEFLLAVDPRLCRTVKIQCLPGLSNSPMAPIREMCQILFTQAPARAGRSDVEAALWDELVGETACPAAVLVPLSEHQRKQHSYDLVFRMLAEYCADTPLVLVFEDIHWLDATSRDCLDAVIQRADGLPLLVVMTTRPSDHPPLSEAVIQLSPLGHHDGLKLLRDNININASEIDDEVADDLVRRAAGNPFFIEELALALQGDEGPSRELPETVQAVISVRIGALDPAARAFLYVIAVIGPGARADLVRHLLGDNIEGVDATAARLRSMGFILAEPGSYSFRHMLINDTAYTMLAPAERRRLHGDIAVYLESDRPDWTPRAETLAWHHQEAGQIHRAMTYWQEACRAAMQRLAYREAIVFARNGLRLITKCNTDVEKRELDLQLYLASALAAIKGYGAEDVGKAYNRARLLNRSVRNAKANIRILVGLWIHTWVAGHLSQSLAYAQDLLDVANVVQDPALSLQAHASVGEVLLHKGRLSEALSHLTAGLNASADRPPASLPAQNAAVACASYACWASSLMGHNSEAEQFLGISNEFAQVHENPFAQAIHLALCSEHFMFSGQVERCLDYADRAIAISRPHDLAFWLGTGLVMRGWALGQLGQFPAAFAALDDGIRVFEATGAAVQLPNWYGLKAETLLTAGRLKEGLTAADHGLHWAAKTGDRFFTPRIHAVIARIWAGLDMPEKTARHARMAAERAAAFGMADSVTTLLI